MPKQEQTRKNPPTQKPDLFSHVSGRSLSR
jgi:hypothetical protein